jgi:hypothetical protein
VKGYIKYLIAILVLPVSVFHSFAQRNSASFTVTATIVETPNTIEKTENLDFGTLAMSEHMDGSVSINTNGRAFASGCVAMARVNDNPSAARFTITGDKDYIYSISFQSEEMALKNKTCIKATSFNSNLPTVGSLGDRGSQTFSVGATLAVNTNKTVEASSPDAPFTVIVNYN